MNREEKLQKLAKLIHQEYKAQEPMKGYSKGDTINLHSMQIEQTTGIELGEQSDALNVLANDYECIKYTAVKDYVDESELTPADLLNITEIAMIGDQSHDDIKQTLLEAVSYKIEVFDTITDAVNILGGNLCELTIEYGITPVITIKGTIYRLQSLQAGSIPQKLIEYASKGRYNTQLTSSDFTTLSIAQLNTANYNIVQLFKNNIFGKSGALGDFTAITPKTFLLKKRALLNNDTIVVIQKLAQH
jgi:hypothetical protein